MRSYLTLVPLSAKVHHRQTRMTRVCILLAVFLVTVIFGMADMELRSQKAQALQSDGAWHVFFRGLSDEDAMLLAARPDVALSARYDVFNYGLDEDCAINGVQTVLCGFDEALTAMIPTAQIAEGSFPAPGPDSNPGTPGAVVTPSVRDRLGLANGDSFVLTGPPGAVVTPSVRDRLGLAIGDSFVLSIHGRDEPLTVTGFAGESSMLTDKDAFGIYLNTAAYRRLIGTDGADTVCFVQFATTRHLERTISEVAASFGLPDDQITRNVKLLGLMGQSRDSYMVNLYLTAGVLAVLVITAGVLMISGSLNSNIAQQITFFGTLRCLGATPVQIRRFVRAEALYWCLTAVPAGAGLGVVLVWVLCAVLKAASPSYFAGMPVLAVSGISIVLGAVVGFFTVLVAAQAPAKKAARVSPLVAVSGNADTAAPVRRAANTRLMRVETALGVHHAFASKRNYLLMVGSFTLSIVLFLAFGTAIPFLNHALKPLKPYTPDVSVISADNTCSLPGTLAGEVAQMAAVKRAYGRSFAYGVPAAVAGGEKTLTVNLISYEENQFGWAKNYLLAGSIAEAEAGGGVLLVYAADSGAAVGDLLRADFGAGEQAVTVCGTLSDSPFDRDENTETLICSEALFRQLTGQAGYTILDIQLKSDATDADVAAIRAAAGEGVTISDKRLSNRDVRGAYYSMALFLYGFLVVIALISALHIINSLAMSVAARMHQYGAMRAIGMGDAQLGRMIAAEAAVYAGSGMVLGCVAGLPLHRALFGWLVTARWGTPWAVPFAALAVIFAVIVVSTAL
ncbi:MAG: ABC transporter permease, partial [Gemmiger sp.]|nr:ABC transporter permease [Gemmiger sp.]